jgi:hypothetical protein
MKIQKWNDKENKYDKLHSKNLNFFNKMFFFIKKIKFTSIRNFLWVFKIFEIEERVLI